MAKIYSRKIKSNLEKKETKRKAEETQHGDAPTKRNKNV